MGLVSSITAQGKILLRKLTSIEPRLGWDDPIPSEYQSNWNAFIKHLESLQTLSFNRCIKPDDAVDNPILLTFSDTSENMFCACCYLKWKTSQGTFKSKLLMSKNRVAPIKR